MIIKIYFLRGLIDGDGCFYKNSKATQFSICNSLNFDWNFLQKYLVSLELNCVIIKRIEKSGNSSIIRATNKYEIKNFIEFLYKVKDNIWLDRKYNKAMMIVKNII